MKITIERTELLQHALVGYEAQRADIERRIAEIRLQLNGEPVEAPKTKRRRRRKMSAEGRANIAAATKLRWEKWRKAQRAKK